MGCLSVCKPSVEKDCNHERNKSRHCSHVLFHSTPPTPHSTIMRVRANSDFEALSFQNANGEPYSSASFTKRLQRLFERLTGRRVSISVLRSSFLTWAYSVRDCVTTPKSSTSIFSLQNRHTVSIQMLSTFPSAN